MSQQISATFTDVQKVIKIVHLNLQPVTKHSITSHNTHILRDSPVRTSNLSDVDFIYFITLLSPNAFFLPTYCHSVMLIR